MTLTLPRLFCTEPFHCCVLHLREGCGSNAVKLTRLVADDVPVPRTGVPKDSNLYIEGGGGVGLPAFGGKTKGTLLPSYQGILIDWRRKDSVHAMQYEAESENVLGDSRHDARVQWFMAFGYLCAADGRNFYP